MKNKLSHEFFEQLSHHYEQLIQQDTRVVQILAFVFDFFWVWTVVLCLHVLASEMTGIRFTRSASGGLVDFYTAPAIYVAIFVYSLYITISSFHGRMTWGTYLFLLFTVARNKHHPQPSKKKTLVKNISFCIVLILLCFIVYPLMSIALLLIFPWKNFSMSDIDVLTHAFTAVGDHQQITAALHVSQMVSVVVTAGIGYVLLVSMWNKRGLPDLIASTQVIQFRTSLNRVNIFRSFFLLLLFFFLIYPLTAFAESRVLPRVVAARTIYTDPSGWIISYNPSLTTIRTMPDQSGTIHIEVSGACTANLFVVKDTSSPQGKSLARVYESNYTHPMKTEGLPTDFKSLALEHVSPTVINGYEAWNAATEPVGNLSEEVRSVHMIINAEDSILHFLSITAPINPSTGKRLSIDQCAPAMTEMSTIIQSFHAAKQPQKRPLTKNYNTKMGITLAYNPDTTEIRDDQDDNIGVSMLSNPPVCLSMIGVRPLNDHPTSFLKTTIPVGQGENPQGLSLADYFADLWRTKRIGYMTDEKVNEEHLNGRELWTMKPQTDAAGHITGNRYIMGVNHHVIEITTSTMVHNPDLQKMNRDAHELCPQEEKYIRDFLLSIR